jgi:hypothetical protein
MIFQGLYGFFMKEKLDTFTKFKKYKELVEGKI